jgi:uncharacterized phiE125 gp8 family phage protein
MIDIAALRQHLRIGHELDDALLETYEAAAVAYLERTMDRYFGPPRSRVVVLRGSAVLYLDGPVVSVVDVTVRSYPADEGEALTVGTDYTVVGDSVRLTWPYAHGWEYEVEYTQGYAAGTEPADVQLAVLQLVAQWYESRMPVVVGTIAANIPNSVAALIAAGRRVRA